MMQFLKDPKKKAEFGRRFFTGYLILSLAYLIWGPFEVNFQPSYRLVAPGLHVFTSAVWIVAAKKTLKDLERTKPKE